MASGLPRVLEDLRGADDALIFSRGMTLTPEAIERLHNLGAAAVLPERIRVEEISRPGGNELGRRGTADGNRRMTETAG